MEMSASLCGCSPCLASPSFRSTTSSTSLSWSRRSSRISLAIGNGRRMPSQRRPGRGKMQVFALTRGVDYEFFEEGGGLEVRVPLPPGGQFTARHVAVDTQSSSLCVGVRAPDGVKILLNATSLYGRIRPHETVWFVDDSEVVMSLRKLDFEQPWPDLVQVWESLATGLAAQLKGASVYLVGDSTEKNWSVAQELAAGLGYVPMKTEQLIENLLERPVGQILNKEGEEALAGCEEAVLKTLSQHVRCVVGTIGGSGGAASRPSGWNSLHSGFTVWLSESQAKDEDTAQVEAVRAKLDGKLGYSKADVVVAIPAWDSDAVRPTAEGALRALKQLLDSDKELPGRKSLYLRLGCRGDWPNIMPPGWNPDSPSDAAPESESMIL